MQANYHVTNYHFHHLNNAHLFLEIKKSTILADLLATADPNPYYMLMANYFHSYYMRSNSHPLPQRCHKSKNGSKYSTKKIKKFSSIFKANYNSNKIRKKNLDDTFFAGSVFQSGHNLSKEVEFSVDL